MVGFGTPYMIMVALNGNGLSHIWKRPQDVPNEIDLLRKWLLIAFCLENPLSHCLALFPASLAIYDHRSNSHSQKKLQEQS